MKQYVVESEHVPEGQIAIAMGDQCGLDKVNLFDATCPIEIVITVQALKEGWDCSFAYVFRSTTNIHSGKDVEQFAGPRATGGIVESRLHFRADKLLQFRRQGNIHRMPSKASSWP